MGRGRPPQWDHLESNMAAWQSLALHHASLLTASEPRQSDPKARARTCTCTCSGRDGSILDVVHKHKPSALDAAVVTAADRELWPEGTHEVPGDEVIHVRPKQLDPKAEVSCGGLWQMTWQLTWQAGGEGREG